MVVGWLWVHGEELCVVFGDGLFLPAIRAAPMPYPPKFLFSASRLLPPAGAMGSPLRIVFVSPSACLG